MKTKGILSILIMGFFIASFTLNNTVDKKPWPVPAAAKAKKNAVATNAESIKEGRSLWSTHCKSCHGAKGLGDGTKAAQLKTEPGDFTKYLKAETICLLSKRK